MRRIFLASLLAFSLSGCVTALTELESAGDYICENRDATRLGLEIAYARALQIENDSRRELALKGIEISYAALDACPEDF